MQKRNARWDQPTGHLVLATSYSRTTCRRTTIGAAAFHFRVRNGNGWGHCAIITRVRCRTGSESDGHIRRFAARQADAELWRLRPLVAAIELNRRGRFGEPRYLIFQKNMISNRQSPSGNRKLVGSLIATYRPSGSSAVKTAATIRLRFVLDHLIFSVYHHLVAEAMD